MKENRNHLLITCFYEVLSKRRNSSPNLNLAILVEDFHKYVKESKKTYFGFIRTGLNRPPSQNTTIYLFLFLYSLQIKIVRFLQNFKNSKLLYSTTMFEKN